MTLGDVIHQYRKKNGLTMEDFAKKAGLSKGYVSLLEQNKSSRGGKPSPKFEIYEKAARAMGIQVQDLTQIVCGEADVPPPHPMDLISLRPMKQIPLVGQIACGATILAEQNIIDYVDLPHHISADYALTCKGDSMIGVGVQDGDLVYIRQQEQVENGQIAAVTVDQDEATLKRFYLNKNILSLIAENPQYEPQIFVGEEINRVKVEGLAVAFIHLLK